MEKAYKTMEQLKDSRLLYDQSLPAFGNAIIIVLSALVGALVWSIYTPRTYVVQSNGTIVIEAKNYIMSTYTGEITEAYVSEGDYVERGIFYSKSPVPILTYKPSKFRV